MSEQEQWIVLYQRNNEGIIVDLIARQEYADELEEYQWQIEKDDFKTIEEAREDAASHGIRVIEEAV